MSDLTPAPVIDGADPDPSTAYGRLRILWSATADPELVMTDSEVADVEAVLNEHAAMAAELKQLRADFAEQLADAKEMVLEKLVEAFGEGWDNCRMFLDDEARRGRGICVGQYSNGLPWPPSEPEAGAAAGVEG